MIGSTAVPRCRRSARAARHGARASRSRTTAARCTKLFSLASELADHLQSLGTVVVPTHARARAVQLAYAARALARGERVWPSADVLTAAAWLGREAERAASEAPAGQPRCLSAAEEWYLWRACTREAVQELPLLDPDACAAALQRAEALAEGWQIRLNAATGSEGALLIHTRRAVQARCRELHAVTAGELLTGSAPPHAPVYPAGFGQVPPQLVRLGGVAPRPLALPQPAELLTVADRDEEAARIASWCRGRIGARAETRLLVLLPGGGGAVQPLAALIRQALDPAGALEGNGAGDAWVAVEAAETLSAQPALRHALTTLRLLGGAELDTVELSAWLTAPFWTDPVAVLRARIALALRETGTPAASVQPLLGALQRLPPELLAAGRELAAVIGRARAAWREARAAPRAWAERCRTALTAAGWPGPLMAHAAGIELQVRWHELLEAFGELTACAGTLAAGEALELLAALAARSPWRAPPADASVTLATTLFDPIVRYDGIWVAGLDAQSFPLPAEPDPFIPLAAQRSAGVPAASAAGRLAEARQLLAAWQRSTTELIVSAPRHAEDLELLPSPLFTPRAAPGDPPQVWLPRQLHRDGVLTTLRDETGLPWRSPAPLPRGIRSVELQNLCPFRAYAELRLGSVRPESIEPGIPAHRRGTLLHSALQYLWERLQDSQTLARMDEGALRALIEACVARARDELSAPPPPGRRRTRSADGQLDLFRHVPPLLQREGARAVRLIEALCARERKRPAFKVALTEYQTELALAGARLRLRIDRVDEFPDGSRAILDYKSGKRLAADLLGERPAHTQLLVYGCALPGDVAALATVAINAHGVRFDGLARAAGMLPDVGALPGAGADRDADWARQRAAWRALLERLIRAFLAGKAAVDPRPRACLSCHVTDICRISEAARARDEDPPESAHE
jgi:ATP-dependent helicase/nuclease subunit B